MTPRPPFRSILREKEFWLLLLIGTVYFYRLFFLGETLFFREIHSFLLPQKHLLAESLRQGQLPLWDPSMHGGMPYLANVTNTPLHPGNLLYAILPFFTAFRLIFGLHLLASGAATYLLMRVLRGSPLSAALAGIIYGFCGYTLSYTNLTGAFMATPLLPLSLMFWHLYLLEKKRRWFVFTVIVGCIRVFSGAPEANILGMAWLLGWALLYPYPNFRWFRRLTAWGLLGALTVGVSLIQILPTLEMMLFSPRGEKLGYESFAGWSMYPLRLPELLIPNFSGYLDTLLPQVYYWGNTAAPSKQAPYIINVYIGLVSIMLAVYGGLARAVSEGLPRRVRIALTVVAVGGLVYSFGDFLPGFELIYEYVPLIGFFRYPIKSLSLSMLPVALLAGYAADMLFAPSATCRAFSAPLSKSGRVVVMAISLALGAGTVAFFVSDSMARRVQELFFHQSSAIIRGNLQWSLGHAAAVAGAFTSILLMTRMKSHWRMWALVALVTADLLVAGRRLNPTASTLFFTDTPPLVPLVRQEIGDGRLYRTPTPKHLSVQAPSLDMIWLYRWGLEVLENYNAIAFQIPTIFHEGLSIAPRRLKDLNAVLPTLPWEQRLPLLATGAVNLVLTSDDVQVPGLKKIADIDNFSSLPLYLYRHQQTAARVAVVTRWQYAQSREAAFEALLQPSYDPRTFVILETPPQPIFEFTHFNDEQKPATDMPAGACGPPEIRHEDVRPHSQTLFVSSACDGYLVFAEPWHPGWRATVDDAPVGIWRANYAFSAIFLPAGTHQVIREYHPNSLILGTIFSIGCWGLLAVMSWKRLGI